MDRRSFVLRAGGALIALPLLHACAGGGDGGGDPPGPPPTATGGNAVYTSSKDDDHTHELSIPQSAFTAPADLDTETTNDDGHLHDVIVHAADLQAVASGQTVAITTSETFGHTHVFTLVAIPA